MKRIAQLRRLLPFLALAASLQLTLGYYDPSTQRWINRDPLPAVETQNLFAFVGNSPQLHTDALGLFRDDWIMYKCEKPANPCVLVWDCSPRPGGRNCWSTWRIHVRRIPFWPGKYIIISWKTLACHYFCSLKSAVGTGCPADAIPGVATKTVTLDYSMKPWVTTCPTLGDVEEIR